jgi:hypothetical protein
VTDCSRVFVYSAVSSTATSVIPMSNPRSGLVMVSMVHCQGDTVFAAQHRASGGPEPSSAHERLGV